MLSVEDIEQGIADIAAVASAVAPLPMLVGGVALQFYGSDRFTADLDVVLDRPLPRLKRGAPLTFGGYSTTSRPGGEGVPVDVIIRDDDYKDLYDEALQYGWRRLPDVPLPVVSPEYAVVMKMAARRAKDVADLAWLLEQDDLLDLDKTRRIVKRFLGRYGLDDFEATLREATWRKSI